MPGYESILHETQHPMSWQKIQELERPLEKEEFEAPVEQTKPRVISNLQVRLPSQPYPLNAN